MRTDAARLILLVLSLFLNGCRTVPPVAINLAEPGWTVHEGQALWRAKAGANPVVTELLAASHRDGRSWLQVSKAGLPFFSGLTSSNRWQIQLHTENRHHSAQGRPPVRLGWLQLAENLAGRPLAVGWRMTATDQGWRLESSVSGEQIEGFFIP